ncbi:TPA: 3-dehydroquinate synthase II, partial [Candidatus Bathyarchaeota archaeon]|nr:3-dehydroquinate synthase II [Candidatus Bathyarchaeota archaeon]
VEEAKKMGVKKVAGVKGGNVKLFNVASMEDLKKLSGEKGEMAAKVSVKNKSDENLMVSAAKAGARYVIASCQDWKVIPLENLIAKIHGSKSELIAEVSNVEEAKIALKTLELGVDGVLINVSSVSEIKAAANVVKELREELKLTSAKVIGAKPLEIGARACIDTCDIMREGEGVLAGSQSMGLFLIQAEVQINPYVEPRPFRVNAGAISSYILVPGNKTKYLSELKAGDEVLIVDREGKTRISNICRIKIEYRPLLLIEAEHEGKRLNVVLQNAETIRLVTKDGSKSVVELKPGDEVLVRFEEGGRHFGTLVKGETVIER